MARGEEGPVGEQADEDGGDGDATEEHVEDYYLEANGLEGVGAGSLRHADLITVLVWVNAPEAVALERALTRDGAEVEEQLRQWHLDEEDHFARERTRERADLVHETG